jgi:3-hydroxyisobutyrate dehydrogenase-like beta-hydroxyacid dehydrogenase
VPQRVGFIGIGAMGLPMSLRLMDRGYPLTVFDVNDEAMRPVIARGARAAGSPAEVASEAGTVLVSLPDPDAVRQVAIGEHGIKDGTEARIYVDFSTTGAGVSEAVAAVLQRKGVSVLDAPVSGGVPGTEKGSLTVMVSGAQGAFEACRPLLEIVGSKIVYVGEKPGSAQTMKVLNNMLSATALAVSSEVFVLGVKAGLDPEIMLEVINSSSGRNTATSDKFPRSILPRTFDYGFRTGLVYKDLTLCIQQAEALGVPMWVGGAVRQLWGYAMSQGAGPKDFTTIIQYIEAWAGVEVRRSK